jgi:hypothetical protein
VEEDGVFIHSDTGNVILEIICTANCESEILRIIDDELQSPFEYRIARIH